MARRPQRARGRAARWGAALGPLSSRLSPSGPPAPSRPRNAIPGSPAPRRRGPSPSGRRPPAARVPRVPRESPAGRGPASEPAHRGEPVPASANGARPGQGPPPAPLALKACVCVGGRVCRDERVAARAAWSLLRGPS